MKGEFIDISKLTCEDLDEIKHLGAARSLDFQQALYIFMEENPDKAKVLGYIDDEGKIQSDNITESGVSTKTGAEAISDIINKAIKNKNDRSNN